MELLEEVVAKNVRVYDFFFFKLVWKKRVAKIYYNKFLFQKWQVAEQQDFKFKLGTI